MLTQREFLESICIGVTNFTSMEALRRFFAKSDDEEPPQTLGALSTPPNPTKPDMAAKTMLMKKAERAKDELRRRGVVK